MLSHRARSDRGLATASHTNLLLAVGLHAVALVLWVAGQWTESSTLLTISVFVGTAVTAAAVTIVVAFRFMAQHVARIFRSVLWALTVGTGIAVLYMHLSQSSAEGSMVLAATVAVGGTVVVMAVSVVSSLSMSAAMARNYFRVSSGRRAGVAALLMGIGASALCVPLVFTETLEFWPLVGLPSIALVLYGHMGLTR